MRRVLIVCRKKQAASPFITEQADAIAGKGIEIQYFFIEGHGMRAYIKSLPRFYRIIRKYEPDIIHAHYGLSGFFANLQRMVSVVTTYHGTDINVVKSRYFSMISSWLSKRNIFVSEKLACKARAGSRSSIIPCGINMDVFSAHDKEKAREKMNLGKDKTYVLFASAFSNPIKNAALAISAVKKAGAHFHLIELKGYSRKEVMLLFNACDAAIMTSLMEGSPQFIKEAMACNCPVVTTNVGSVKEIIDGTEGCYICEKDAEDLSEKLKLVLASGKRTNGHRKVKHLDNEVIADRIISVYESVWSK